MAVPLTCRRGDSRCGFQWRGVESVLAYRLLERTVLGSEAVESGSVTTRQRILRVASALFAQKGYHGTSTREIATAVGIQQPSLFHHFESKEAIMSELIDFDLDEPLAVAEREAAATGSPAVRLFRYLAWDVEYLCESPYNLCLLYTSDAADDN